MTPRFSLTVTPLVSRTSMVPSGCSRSTMRSKGGKRPAATWNVQFQLKSKPSFLAIDLSAALSSVQAAASSALT